MENSSLPATNTATDIGPCHCLDASAKEYTRSTDDCVAKQTKLFADAYEASCLDIRYGPLIPLVKNYYLTGLGVAADIHDYCGDDVDGDADVHIDLENINADSIKHPMHALSEWINNRIYIPSNFRYIKDNGVDIGKSNPCEGIDDSCHFVRAAVGATGAGYFDIPDGGEDKMKKAEATTVPISCSRMCHLIKNSYKIES
uniref:Uncharacterized protein n=1 Tax=Glossina palpalis gambiensis TaxID=67801 RepID=A0A1B0B9Z6_9MUSC